MVYIKPRHSTMKQTAYAHRLLGGQGKSKKEIALNSGYSPYVANSVSSHIENKVGFNNAMSALARESNNLALEAMSEFKARGFKDFTNKELVGALNAIGSAWAKFTADKAPKELSPSANRLKTVVLQRIDNQTINNSEISSSLGVGKDSPPPTPKEEKVTDTPTKEELDF